MKYSFGKLERLHKRDEIQTLLSQGKSFHEFPFRVVYLPVSDHSTPLKVMFSIPKKRFKRAVDRNLLKRRTKEAYRLNRLALKEVLTKQDKGLHLLLIYQSDERLPFMEIQAKIKLILLRLEKQYV